MNPVTESFLLQFPLEHLQHNLSLLKLDSEWMHSFPYEHTNDYPPKSLRSSFSLSQNIDQGTKIFQNCTCLAGRVTYNFHSSCKHMHLSFKNVCNKEHKGVICNMISSINSCQSTHPVGPVLWEELLVLSRFHS